MEQVQVEISGQLPMEPLLLEQLKVLELILEKLQVEILEQVQVENLLPQPQLLLQQLNLDLELEKVKLLDFLEMQPFFQPKVLDLVQEKLQDLVLQKELISQQEQELILRPEILLQQQKLVLLNLDLEQEKVPEMQLDLI